MKCKIQKFSASVWTEHYQGLILNHENVNGYLLTLCDGILTFLSPCLHTIQTIIITGKRGNAMNVDIAVVSVT